MPWPAAMIDGFLFADALSRRQASPTPEVPRPPETADTDPNDASTGDAGTSDTGGTEPDAAQSASDIGDAYDPSAPDPTAPGTTVHEPDAPSWSGKLHPQLDEAVRHRRSALGPSASLRTLARGLRQEPALAHLQDGNVRIRALLAPRFSSKTRAAAAPFLKNLPLPRRGYHPPPGLAEFLLRRRTTEERKRQESVERQRLLSLETVVRGDITFQDEGPLHRLEDPPTDPSNPAGDDRSDRWPE